MLYFDISILCLQGQAPSHHTCHKNHSGSSKGMEPDVAGELVAKVEEKGIRVETLIMDDDTTTMARIRRTVDHEKLTTPVIKYLKKCFSYALQQNKGEPDNLRSALLNIAEHTFGNHSECGPWCGYVQNPDTYKHSNIDKDLCGDELKTDLKAIFKTFSNNADKIAPCGSTKEVESFNNMVGSKAPKRCHYSASGSLISRVECAVAQKNIGYTYINDVNIAAGLSPGVVAREICIKKDNERKRQLTYSNDLDVKKRKIQQKLNKQNEMYVS